jgi:hypothetical protein
MFIDRKSMQGLRIITPSEGLPTESEAICKFNNGDQIFLYDGLQIRTGIGQRRHIEDPLSHSCRIAQL